MYYSTANIFPRPKEGLRIRKLKVILLEGKEASDCGTKTRKPSDERSPEKSAAVMGKRKEVTRIYSVGRSQSEIILS